MAAEIVVRDVPRVERPDASMRPRRMAAEIARRLKYAKRFARCFNEAAANGRGNRRSSWPPCFRDV